MNYRYNTYPYGHDYGNSKTCGIAHIGGATCELSLPSALAEGSYEELSDKISDGNLKQLGIINEHAHIIRVNGNELYVGDLAIEQSPSVSIAELTSRGDISRYWSVRSLAMLLATSGTLIKDREYGLTVVSGLPIATHTPDNTNAVKAALEGDHAFTLDGVERIAHVTIKKVIAEGSGANIAHGAIGKVKAGIVDVGGRTTDIYMVSGLAPIPDQCRSLDVGVETAMDTIAASFEKAYHWPLSAMDAAKLQVAYIGDKRYDMVASVRNANANPHGVDALLSKAINETGRKLSGFIKRSWSSSLRSDVVAADAEYVLLVGGGAYYFDESVKALFPNRLIIPHKPECANASGYARLALHFFKRESKEMVV